MRSLSIATDSFGIDPLRDSVLNQLDSIRNYTDHIVKENESGNPQIISFNYYGTTDLYFVVLAYNGLGNSMALSAGESLKIPDRASVLALFSTEKQKTKRKVKV